MTLFKYISQQEITFLLIPAKELSSSQDTQTQIMLETLMTENLPQAMCLWLGVAVSVGEAASNKLSQYHQLRLNM